MTITGIMDKTWAAKYRRSERVRGPAKAVRSLRRSKRCAARPRGALPCRSSCMRAAVAGHALSRCPRSLPELEDLPHDAVVAELAQDEMNPRPPTKRIHFIVIPIYSSGSRPASRPLRFALLTSTRDARPVGISVGIMISFLASRQWCGRTHELAQNLRKAPDATN